MLLEVLFVQRLCQNVCRLILRFDWMDRDYASVDISAEVPQSVVEKLGSRPVLMLACNFDGSAVVLKYLAVDLRSSADWVS